VVPRPEVPGSGKGVCGFPFPVKGGFPVPPWFLVYPKTRFPQKKVGWLKKTGFRVAPPNPKGFPGWPRFKEKGLKGLFQKRGF